MNGYRTNWVVLCALVFLGASCGDSKDGDATADAGVADTNPPEDTTPPKECTNDEAGTACDDGDPCTVNDACDSQGSCVGEATKVCSESDGKPCTEARCDAALGSPDNEYCVESPITVAEAENACYKYSCTDGVQEQLGLADANTCGEWVVPEGGCIDHYVCDSQFTNSTDGSHCRPVSKAEGTPCLDDGVGVKAATMAASADSLSSCWLYVCHTAPGPDTALTTAQCVLSSSLSAEAQSTLEAAGSKLSHNCSLDDMPETISRECNDWRCGCNDASCTQAECQVDPQESKVGQPCDNGNLCDASVCMPAKGSSPFMTCEATQDGECDDGNPCTQDSCTEGECQFTPLVSDCDDTDACTTNDQCLNSACVGEPLDCNDNDVCTGIETCDATTGCVVGTALVCNDNDVCTVDSCDPVLGCTYFITDPNCGEPPIHDIEQMEGGSAYTCVRQTSGEATCWGSSSYGKLTLPVGVVIKDISAGWNQTCVIDVDNNLLCWGIDNGTMWDFGQVTDAPSGKFISVSGGFNQTCAVEESGAVICWGISPANIADPSMDVYDKGQVTDAPTGSFVAVASGHSHSCALRSDGGIECWGSNNPKKDTPTATNFVKLAAGYHHNCAIDTESKLTCWGWTSWGLVSNVPTGTFQDVSCGYGHTCAVRTTGELECWGVPQNPSMGSGVQDKGQVTDAPTTGSFTHVGVGGSHSCAVTTAGKVECWGNPLGTVTQPPLKFQ